MLRMWRRRRGYSLCNLRGRFGGNWNTCETFTFSAAQLCDENPSNRCRPFGISTGNASYVLETYVIWRFYPNVGNFWEEFVTFSIICVFESVCMSCIRMYFCLLEEGDFILTPNDWFLCLVRMVPHWKSTCILVWDYRGKSITALREEKLKINFKKTWELILKNTKN